MDGSTEFDHSSRCTTTTRWVPEVFECRLALLHWRDQHQRWVPLVLFVVASRWRRQGQNEEGIMYSFPCVIAMIFETT